MARTPRTPPFMGTTAAKSAKGAALAVFGAPHGTPYKTIDNRPHQTAPDAFRRAVAEDGLWVSHWDFDFDGPLLPDQPLRAIDLGNLATTPKDGAGNRRKILAQTRAILAEGAVPLMFGGDDSVPIPFLAAYAGGPPITVVQIDAHIDWRDNREGERQGYSSTMRRASEMDHVWRIVQAGAHGLGSARAEEVSAARQWGARLVPAQNMHREGVKSVLQHIEPGSLCVICLDLDVLDAAVMPAVAHPSPGGLSFLQVTELIDGIAEKAAIGGFAMVEFVPKRDLSGTSAYTAARIALHVLHHVAKRHAAKHPRP
jgi:agmatinase